MAKVSGGSAGLRVKPSDSGGEVNCKAVMLCVCRPGHMRHMLLMSSYAVEGKGWRIVNVRSFSRGIVTTRVRKTVSLVGGMIGADANVCVGRLLLFC